jgi:hypothetical protein
MTTFYDHEQVGRLRLTGTECGVNNLQVQRQKVCLHQHRRRLIEGFRKTNLCNNNNRQVLSMNVFPTAAAVAALHHGNLEENGCKSSLSPVRFRFCTLKYLCFRCCAFRSLLYNSIFCCCFCVHGDVVATHLDIVLSLQLSFFFCSHVDDSRLFGGQMDTLLYHPLDVRRSKSYIIKCIVRGICYCGHLVVVFDDLFAQSQGFDRPCFLERLLSPCHSKYGKYPFGDIFDLDTSLVAIVGILGTFLGRITSHGMANGNALFANIGFLLKKSKQLPMQIHWIITILYRHFLMV